MARYTATFSVTEAGDWEAGDFFRFDKFRDQVGQNLEWFAQNHDHSGDPGDGGTIPGVNMTAIWAYGPATPTWG